MKQTTENKAFNDHNYDSDQFSPEQIIEMLHEKDRQIAKLEGKIEAQDEM